jgi:hypothetical protein
MMSLMCTWVCSIAHGRTPGGDVRDGPAPQRMHRLRRRRVPDVAKAQLAARAIAPAPQQRSLRVCGAFYAEGVDLRWTALQKIELPVKAFHEWRGPLQPGRPVGLSLDLAPRNAATCVRDRAGAPRMQAPGLAAAAPGVRLPSRGDQQRMPRPGAHLTPRREGASAPCMRCPVLVMPGDRWQAHAPAA